MKLIKIHNPKTTNYKLIEWQLHDVCNFDCSFCDDRSKGGTRRWLDTDVYLSALDTFMKQAESQNKTVYFMFTGGEPTLMPDFLELPKFVKNRGHRVNIITNGSRTLRWWADAAQENCFDNIWLSMHSEQGMDPKHIVDLIELFKDLPTNITTIVTAPPTNFDQSYDSHRYIVENAVCISSFRYIYKIGGDLLPYTQDQLKILQENTSVKSRRFSEKTHGWISYPWQNINVVFEDGSEVVSTAMNFVSKGIYNFLGWKCSAGMDFLRIEHTDIFRGTCRQGGRIGSILDEQFGFATSEITCMAQRCKCIADFNQPKYKILT